MLDKIEPSGALTALAIYKHYKTVGDKGQGKGYLSASIIGHPCEAYLWYTFRACCQSDYPGRMYRLFATGNLEERRVEEDLRNIGCEVHLVDRATGQQFSLSAIGGHFTGHIDGCVRGIPEAPTAWHVLEIKTHNTKSFNELKAKGLKAAHPKYYAQAQVYMRLSGMERCLHFNVCKETDELYIERLHYCEEEAETLLERARRIIEAQQPPERISTRPDYYICKMCSAHSICWGSDKVAVSLPGINCRQCCHATPIYDGAVGQWVCEKYKRGLSSADQERVCESHLLLPGLLPYAKPSGHGEEEGKEFICFVNVDGTAWKHGAAKRCYSTEELTKLPIALLGNELIGFAKDLFGAKVAGVCEKDLMQDYPSVKIVWQGRASGLIKAWANRYNEDLTALTPIARTDNFEAVVTEYPGKRAAVLWKESRWIEIREGESQ